MPHPVVRLNHAVAVGMANTLSERIRLVDRLAASGELEDYYLLQATRADPLRRLGERGEAAAAYQRALSLTCTDAERCYLTRRLEEVTGSSADTSHVSATRP